MTDRLAAIAKRVEADDAMLAKPGRRATMSINDWTVLAHIAMDHRRELLSQLRSRGEAQDGDVMERAVKAWAAWDPPTSAKSTGYGILRAAFTGGYLAASAIPPPIPAARDAMRVFAVYMRDQNDLYKTHSGTKGKYLTPEERADLDKILAASGTEPQEDKP